MSHSDRDLSRIEGYTLDDLRERFHDIPVTDKTPFEYRFPLGWFVIGPVFVLAALAAVLRWRLMGRSHQESSPAPAPPGH